MLALRAALRPRAEAGSLGPRIAGAYSRYLDRGAAPRWPDASATRRRVAASGDRHPGLGWRGKHAAARLVPYAVSDQPNRVVDATRPAVGLRDRSRNRSELARSLLADCIDCVWLGRHSGLRAPRDAL